jgi:hypothetical protein
MRAKLIGPRFSAASIRQCIAVCHAFCSCSALGSLVMYWPASRNVLAILPFGSFTGSSKVASHDIRNSTQQSRDSSVDLAIGSGSKSFGRAKAGAPFWQKRNPPFGGLVSEDRDLTNQTGQAET